MCVRWRQSTTFNLLLGKLFTLILGYVSYQRQSGVGEGIMPMAYVLITTETGAMESVRESLKKIEYVTETYMVYGVYDIIATVKAETMDKLKEIVTWNLRSLDKVRSTLTMIVVEETK
jgi:DNA-binding Lrp family transcriptional regulator